jgi:predicted amidohydrolase
VQPGDTKPSNTLILAAPDGAVTRYRKIHPFSYGGEHEKYAAGTERVTLDVEGVRCSLFVCYDLRFADEFWAVAPDTDCYVVVANWPAARREHWRTLLQARAIENQAFVVGANRVGRGGGLEYSGDSAIVLPFGRRLEASEGQGEEILLHDVTADEVAETRSKYPFIADRR